MSSITLGNLRTRSRRYLKELTPASSYWSEDHLDDMINSQYLLLCAKLVMSYEGWFVSVAVRDIVADQALYSFPEDSQRLQKVELVRTDGRTVPLERYERHATVNSTSTAIGDQYLPTYRPLGNGIVLEPSPGETRTDGLRMEFVGLPAKITAANDALHPSFPAMFDELLVLSIVVNSLDSEGMQEAGQARTILRQRNEWIKEFDRFIENRVVSRQGVEPFVGHYADA